MKKKRGSKASSSKDKLTKPSAADGSEKIQGAAANPKTSSQTAVAKNNSPEAKPKAKPKGEPKGKPKADTKKRSGVVEVDTRHKFTSRAYHKAKTRAKRNGYDEEEQKKRARKASAKAAEKWDDGKRSDASSSSTEHVSE